MDMSLLCVCGSCVLLIQVHCLLTEGAVDKAVCEGIVAATVRNEELDNTR